jgi:hypothetical protein
MSPAVPESDHGADPAALFAKRAYYAPGPLANETHAPILKWIWRAA